MLQKIIMTSLVALALSILLVSCEAFSKNFDASKGLVNGQLAECPKSPNCVSSTSKQEKKILPALALPAGMTWPDFLERVRTLNIGEKITLITEQNNSYAHFTFVTKTMRFVDDVEFLYNTDRVEFRSASRLGYGDMDTNKKRIEKIRANLTN